MVVGVYDNVVSLNQLFRSVGTLYKSLIVVLHFSYLSHNEGSLTESFKKVT